MGFISNLFKSPQQPRVEVPKPVEPLAAPVKISDTAAAERARLESRQRRRGAIGARSNILTPLGRVGGMGGGGEGPVQRRTLGGQ